MVDANIPHLAPSYKHIFIVDTKEHWNSDNNYDPATDLVLTFDFGLKQYIFDLGGECYFVDHLIGQERMEENNYRIYKFFQTWHNNENGIDIFTYKDIPFGMAFRMDFWNDYTYYFRLYLCLSELKSITFKSLLIMSENKTLIEVLSDLSFKFELSNREAQDNSSFYFPVEKYMTEKLRATGIRGLLYKARALVSNLYGSLLSLHDNFFKPKETKTIFIQEYHPTKQLISHFRATENVNVLLCNFSRDEKWRKNLKERLLPLWGNKSSYEKTANNLLVKFENSKHQSLILDNGENVSDKAYGIILRRVESSLAKKLSLLDACHKYVSRNEVDLSVIIANIGETTTLFDLCCKSKQIPSYLIINGILGVNYSDESKHATHINSYSESIKNNYFKGMDNIVVLGDPRMDAYSTLKKTNVNRENSTVVIGASGFSSIDLGSYVAIEFDFMFDVLTALNSLKESGVNIKVVIKVRPQGYYKQYENFVNEFFPNLVDEIVATKPMKQVLLCADLYISINSQTLFEASCMGIPVIYYKKDNEILPPPFDNKSELVTVTNINDLVTAFYDYQNSHKRYNAFLELNIMEKYIGPLDGRNLDRNLQFINKLLDNSSKDNSYD